MPATDDHPSDIPECSSPTSLSLARRLTRRRFLVVGGAVVATGILAACMDDDEDKDDGSVNDSGGTPTGSSITGDAESPELARFMALSRALTGFEDMDDTELGQVYLDSIASSSSLGGQLDSLYAKAGLGEDPSAVTLKQLESAGAFDADTRPVADAITTAWYTGRYDADTELVVATYINALAWQATGYRPTGPSTCTGATGNWTAAAA